MLAQEAEEAVVETAAEVVGVEEVPEAVRPELEAFLLANVNRLWHVFSWTFLLIF